MFNFFKRKPKPKFDTLTGDHLKKLCKLKEDLWYCNISITNITDLLESPYSNRGSYTKSFKLISISKGLHRTLSPKLPPGAYSYDKNQVVISEDGELLEQLWIEALNSKLEKLKQEKQTLENQILEIAPNLDLTTLWKTS